jgi:hypothetical protein
LYSIKYPFFFFGTQNVCLKANELLVLWIRLRHPGSSIHKLPFKPPFQTGALTIGIINAILAIAGFVALIVMAPSIEEKNLGLWVIPLVFLLILCAAAICGYKMKATGFYAFYLSFAVGLTFVDDDFSCFSSLAWLVWLGLWFGFPCITLITASYGPVLVFLLLSLLSLSLNRFSVG